MFRFFILSESDVVVSGEQKASVTGDIAYVVPSGGMSGTITAQVADMVNGDLEFFGNAGLNWQLEDGGNIGMVTTYSKAETSSGYVYNVTGDLEYGNNQYAMKIIDITSDFLTDATGRYGGNQFDWFFTIDGSDVVVNNDQVAGINGDIFYVVPPGAMTGSITTQGRDVVNGDLQFFANAGLSWLLTEGGNVGDVNARCAAELASGHLFNATGVFDYGNNEYSLDVTETVSDFVADAVGTYGGNQYDWLVGDIYSIFL
jgi:hypothetical protein